MLALKQTMILFCFVPLKIITFYLTKCILEFFITKVKFSLPKINKYIAKLASLLLATVFLVLLLSKQI
jgi:hypothetical protein